MKPNEITEDERYEIASALADRVCILPHNIHHRKAESLDILRIAKQYNCPITSQSGCLNSDCLGEHVIDCFNKGYIQLPS